MTFIASVVAKKGVAIIADSLVTSTLPILHYGKFLENLTKQPKNEAGEIHINAVEVQSLFEVEPVYTKDYEEKLFKLNKYTAITTTGIAEINDKKIIDIVNEFIANCGEEINDMGIPLEKRLDQFKEFLTIQVREHLTKISYIGTCIFLFTHYDKGTSSTHIYKMIVKQTEADCLDNAEYQFVSCAKEADWIKVVCNGQNKLSENVLYGSGKVIYENFADIVMTILNKLHLPEGAVPKDFINQLMQDDYFKDILYGEIELLNLTELSLQQAVDLASLLMRLEVDFQRYTRNVPTVGGVIKLAIIDDNGFEPILGHKILPPKHIIL